MSLDFLRFLARLPRAALLFITYCLVGVVGLLDYVTGLYFSWVLFYLLPIGLATWFAGRRAGVLAGLVSAALALLNQLQNWPPDLPVWIAGWNGAVRLGVFLVVCFILAALQAAYEHQKELAETDSLTGAANGRAFFAAMALEIERLKRSEDPLAVAFLDFDNFKIVNDRFGHKTGDLLLCTAVRAIKESIRSTDMVARLGGDEFVILLPATGTATAQAAVERIRQSLLAAITPYDWPVTMSIGVVVCTTPPASVGVILHEADVLLYKAKQQGKNQIQYGFVAQASPPTQAPPLSRIDSREVLS